MTAYVHIEPTGFSDDNVSRYGYLFIFEDGTRLLIHMEADNPPDAVDMEGEPGVYPEELELLDTSQAGVMFEQVRNFIEQSSEDRIEHSDNYETKYTGLFNADIPITRNDEDDDYNRP